MYKSMISNMIIKNINTERARSAIAVVERLNASVTAQTKKRKTGKKKCKCNCGNVPRRTPYPLYLKLIVYKGFGH